MGRQGVKPSVTAERNRNRLTMEKTSNIWISVHDKLPRSNKPIFSNTGRRKKDIFFHWQTGKYSGEYYGWYYDNTFWKTDEGKIYEVLPVTHYIEITTPAYRMDEIKCMKCDKVFNNPGFEERGGTMPWQWVDEALQIGWDAEKYDGEPVWVCLDCRNKPYPAHVFRKE